MATIRALDGFFVRDSTADMTAATCGARDDAPRLFKKFSLATSSWADLAQRVAHASEHEGRELKVLYFVRHAEGVHNAAEKEFGTVKWEAELAKSDEYLDADLTPFGVQDASNKGPPALAAERAKGMPRVERVVVSPLSRAIQTAEIFFGYDPPPLPFVGMELCREIMGVNTCDKRVGISALVRKFPHVDFAVAGASGVHGEHDALWSPTHRETDAEIHARAERFLAQLFDVVPERYVAVVTHSKFMRCLYDLVLPGRVDVYPSNCEVVPLVLERVRGGTTTQQ